MSQGCSKERGGGRWRMNECSNGFALMVPERLEQERLWTSSPYEPSLALCHAARAQSELQRMLTFTFAYFKHTKVC